MEKIKEWIKSYKLKRELAQIEEIYTAQPSSLSEKSRKTRKKRASTGWG